MKLTHVNGKGRPRMVDVSSKEPSLRTAVAGGVVKLSPRVISALESGSLPKGDVFNTAVVAGIQAVKRTDQLIPMCHTLQVSSVEVDLEVSGSEIHCSCSVSAMAGTGFEMEALVGVSTALLTVYDMLKAVDRGMVISDIRLLRKTGGRSGTYTADQLEV